jgi:hypothetical protein
VKRASALVFLLLLASGCACFRASAGFGLGIGGAVRAGVLDVGVLGGGSYEWGNCYGIEGGQCCGELGLPLVGRLEVLRADSEELDRRRLEGPLAIYYAEASDDDARICFLRPAEVAVSAYLGIFAFHLGFDPGAVLEAILGIPEPEIEVVPDEDDMKASDRRGFLNMADGPAFIDAMEADRLVDHTAGGKNAPFRLAVSRSIALLASYSRTSQEWQAVAREETRRSEAAYADALRTRSVDDLEAALDDAPLADGALLAARTLGDLRVEQDDLHGALAAYETERALAEGDEKLEANARIFLVKKGLGSIVPLDADGPEPAEDAGASVASIRSDVLENCEVVVRPIARSRDRSFLLTAWSASRSGLVTFTEVVPDTVVAVGPDGNLLWRTAIPTGSTTIDFILTGSRIFAVRRNEAFALETRSGRIVWRFERASSHFENDVPMDRKAIEKPRLEGPRARLTAEALEWRTDLFDGPTFNRPQRLERLDPSTGVPLAEKR